MVPSDPSPHPSPEFPITLVYDSPSDCWVSSERVDWLLDLLECARQGDGLTGSTILQLRAFACRCARSVWDLWPAAPARQALLTAEAVASGESDSRALVSAWGTSHSIVREAGSLGYHHRCCDAVATLACAHAANPNAVAAAFLSSHYSILAKVWHHVPVHGWVRRYPYSFANWYGRHNSAIGQRPRHDVIRLAEEEVRQAFAAVQARELRELVTNPFEGLTWATLLTSTTKEQTLTQQLESLTNVLRGGRT